MKTFTSGERYGAIARGMDFICRVANRRSLRIDGHALITCFPLIAFTSRDPTLRRMARQFGRDLVLRWQAVCPEVPAKARPNVLLKLVVVGCAGESFGLRNQGLKHQIRLSARRFSAEDLLGFEPTQEPPPDDLPEDCSCGRENPRGRKTCQKCKRRLTIKSRYRTWMRALSITFWGDRYGVVLGARYPDVLRWLPEMRPYPGRRKQTHS